MAQDRISKRWRDVTESDERLPITYLLMNCIEDLIATEVDEETERPWTLSQIARDTGIAGSSLHNWYTGKRSLSEVSLNRLCVYFGLSLSTIEETETVEA